MTQRSIIIKIKKIIKSEKIIVIYSSFFEILLQNKTTGKVLLKDMVTLIKHESKNKTFLLPSFTIPKRLLNLNTEKSISGILSDNIRKIKNSSRTLSAYFSFVVIGPQSKEVISLKPKEVWGVNSVHDWLYKNNALILTIGSEPYNNSIPHYAEWLMHKKINYRKNKKFTNSIIYGEGKFKLSEILFIRKYQIFNDFKKLSVKYKNNKNLFSIKNIKISFIKTKKLINFILVKMKKDTNYLINEKKYNR